MNDIARRLGDTIHRQQGVIDAIEALNSDTRPATVRAVMAQQATVVTEVLQLLNDVARQFDQITSAKLRDHIPGV